MTGTLMPDRVVVINDSSVARGGATALALLSAHGLAERGIAVTFFAGDGPQAAAFAEAGVNAVGLGQRSLREATSVLRGLYNVEAARALKDWIKEHDTPRTIYHVHNWSHILSPSIFVALKLVTGRVVLSAHDFFLACPNGAYVHYASVQPCALKPVSGACVLSNCDKRRYAHKAWRITRHFVRQIAFDLHRERSLVLAIHPAMVPYLERGGVPADMVEVLLNPVTPFSQMRIESEKNSDFVYVGRLDFEKGADIALSAAREAGVRLRLIGDGPLRPALEAQYKEAVFHGQQPKAALSTLVSSAAALVMPTRYPEPFGLAAVEALWSGLPVLLPRTSFLAPQIEACGAGLLFEPGDPPSLAHAMRRISEDASLKARLSKAAYLDTRPLATTPREWLDRLCAIYGRMLVQPLPRIPLSLRVPALPASVGGIP